MLVAIIDDGITPELFSTGTLIYDMIVTKRGRVRKRKLSERIVTYHGTMVAGIIKKYAPATKFCSVRIFSDGIMKATCVQLIAALEWCLKMKIPVINLSLGTTDQDDFNDVRRVADKLLGQEQIVVAACNNNGKYTMPAFYMGVFGVKADATLINNQIRSNSDKDGVPLLASSRHSLALSDGSIITTQVTNSYAAPTVTAKVCNLMQTQKYLTINPNNVANTHDKWEEPSDKRT